MTDTTSKIKESNPQLFSEGAAPKLTQAQIDAMEEADPNFKTDEGLTEDGAANEPEPTGVRVGRDEARAMIFGAKPRAEQFSFFGALIEVRQPTLSVILEKRQISEDAQIYSMMLDYTFIPGTNERLFDDADVESIKGLPFGADLQRFIAKTQSLLAIKAAEVIKTVGEAEKSA